jgi:hypothetical protein
MHYQVGGGGVLEIPGGSGLKFLNYFLRVSLTPPSVHCVTTPLHRCIIAACSLLHSSVVSLLHGSIAPWGYQSSGRAKVWSINPLRCHYGEHCVAFKGLGPLSVMSIWLKAKLQAQQAS